MCGRFALTLPQIAVREHFQASLWPEAMADLAALDRPRFNIRPTETISVVTLDDDGARVVRPMRWGFLPHWYKTASDGPLLINARSETIATKPAFKQACRERRCLIPADGFFEWTVDPDGAKVPHWIYQAEGGGLAFAGVWRAWTGPIGSNGAVQTVATVAIVTCAANDAMSSLHHRLPVVAPPASFGLWLGEEGHGAATVMRAPENDFYAHHPVSRAINRGGRAAPDGPELILPAADAPDEASSAETMRLI